MAIGARNHERLFVIGIAGDAHATIVAEPLVAAVHELHEIDGNF